MSTARVKMVTLLILLNKLLILLTLLTSLQGEADGVYCSDNNPEKPKMAASLESPRKYGTWRLEVKYGQAITLMCSGSDASNIAIKDGEHEHPLKINRINSTTVESVPFGDMQVGWNGFICTDSNTTCTGFVSVTVLPALSVTGPGVRRSSDGNTYFVPRGEVYDVACSAHAANKISLSSWGGNLQTKPVNETTLIATVANDTKGNRYECDIVIIDVILPTDIKVIVDRIPEVQEFGCVLYQNMQLECSWTGFNKEYTYVLYMLRDQMNTRLCSDRPHSLTGGCKHAMDTDLLNLYEFSFSLDLETCNQVYCKNQTFPISSVGSIVKIDPVFRLKLLKTHSRGVSIDWYQHLRIERAINKVEYRLLGMAWQEVDTSAVECLNSYSYKDYLFEHSGCKAELNLPCPDAHYEVRVYVKHVLTSGERYWSDPVSIFFFTTPPGVTDYVDPACDVDFREVTEKPPLTAAHMMYAVRELISDVRKAKSTLKKNVKDVKQKVTKINSLNKKL